uniref:Retrotransposon gag domain-containing protein n=1 Tax=Cucumis melo TaxID=3656 RepID=A0A9I9E6Y8_CUCME
MLDRLTPLFGNIVHLFNRFRMQMIYEIFINYMTEILSLRLEITVCTLVSLGLLVKSVNFEVEKSVVRRLHAIFWSKVASSPGGGGQLGIRAVCSMGIKVERSHATTYWQMTPAESGRDASTLRVRGGAENKQFARTTQEIGRPDRVEPSDLEKAYGIEQLKKLGATVFEGSTNPADAENWLNMLEKCFDVMNCPEERKVRLTTFLLQKEAEGWWKSISARRSDALAEYETKYTELSQYADVIVASESDRCRRFEIGLRFEIRTPVTAIAKWTNFSELVETALRVEQRITEEKSAVKLSRGTSTANGFRSREQQRFTPGINISSHQDRFQPFFETTSIFSTVFRWT